MAVTARCVQTTFSKFRQPNKLDPVKLNSLSRAYRDCKQQWVSLNFPFTVDGPQYHQTSGFMGNRPNVVGEQEVWVAEDIVKLGKSGYLQTSS